jgi:hypothetical protein
MSLDIHQSPLWAVLWLHHGLAVCTGTACVETFSALVLASHQLACWHTPDPTVSTFAGNDLRQCLLSEGAACAVTAQRQQVRRFHFSHRIIRTAAALNACLEGSVWCWLCQRCCCAALSCLCGLRGGSWCGLAVTMLCFAFVVLIMCSRVCLCVCVALTEGRSHTWTFMMIQP